MNHVAITMTNILKMCENLLVRTHPCPVKGTRGGGKSSGSEVVALILILISGHFDSNNRLNITPYLLSSPYRIMDLEK